MATANIWSEVTDRLILEDPGWMPELLRFYEEKIILFEGTPGAVDLTKVMIGDSLQSRYAIGHAKAWLVANAAQGFLESTLCIPVSAPPCKDRFREENQAILDAVETPRFTFAVDKEQTHGADGWIEDHQSGNVYPLEIGHCAFDTFWLRCWDYLSCARWAYGSPFIYVFVFNQAYSDSISLSLDHSCHLAPKASTVMKTGKPYKKAKRTKTVGQLSLF